MKKARDEEKRPGPTDETEEPSRVLKK